MCINIKANVNNLTGMNAKTSNSIRAKNIKSHLLRILLLCFYYISLRLPLTSCRDAASFR